MADTGEDREIKPRAEANEAEVVRESKKLIAKIKQSYRGSNTPTKRRTSAARPRRGSPR